MLNLPLQWWHESRPLCREFTFHASDIQLSKDPSFKPFHTCSTQEQEVGMELLFRGASTLQESQNNVCNLKMTTINMLIIETLLILWNLKDKTQPR